MSVDFAWLRRVVDRMAIPWMMRALDYNYFDCALVIESRMYAGWIRRVELLDHYKESYARWSRPMFDAGLRLRANMPSLRPARTTRPVVGIYIESSAWLAHVALLHRSLEAIPAREYDVHLYLPDRADSEIEKHFAAIGIPCTFLNDTMPAPVWALAERYKHLRELTQKDGVQVMIWLCLAINMSFVYGMGLAPRQVYWSMRAMMNTLVGADDHWMAFNDTAGALEFQGWTWRTTPVLLAPNPAPDAERVAAIRARYPGKIILGTLVREEKLTAGFIETVCDILDRNPDAIYLYAGRQDLPAVRDIFNRRGVGERAILAGWVNTALYAHVFDIYLDCWPARSGVTLFNALEAQTPMVFYMGDHGDHDLSRLSFLFFELQDKGGSYHLKDSTLDASFDLPDGGRGLLAFDTLDAYLACVDRLIRDSAYRKACGASGRALYDYLTDTAMAGRKLSMLIENALASVPGDQHEAA